MVIGRELFHACGWKSSRKRRIRFRKQPILIRGWNKARDVWTGQMHRGRHTLSSRSWKKKKLLHPREKPRSRSFSHLDARGEGEGLIYSRARIPASICTPVIYGIFFLLAWMPRAFPRSSFVSSIRMCVCVCVCVYVGARYSHGSLLPLSDLAEQDVIYKCAIR